MSLSELHPNQVYECSVILLACLNVTSMNGYNIYLFNAQAHPSDKYHLSRNYYNATLGVYITQQSTHTVNRRL